MKAKLTLFFIFIISQISAQTIRGVVLDAKTNEGLPMANVYISNSTKGTQSAIDGKFQLSNLALGNVQLVVSYIGYDIFQQNIVIEQGKVIELSIKLVPNNQILDEVAIKSKRDKSWEKNLKKFKNGFFGASPFASKCKILNEWVIDFDEYPVSGTFVAKAQRPIEVENRALGYKLYYDLREFKLTNQNITFVGSTRFQELQPEDEKEMKRWQENRETAYLGSVRHFFRSLINRTLEKDGFYIYHLNSEMQYNQWNINDFRKISNLITDSNSNQIVQQLSTAEYIFSSKLPLEVTYTNKTIRLGPNPSASPVSRIKQKRPFAIMSDGWDNDPLAFEVLGYWANDRIANILPREYGPTINSNPSVVATQTYSYPRVYLHTNKSDYVAGERIWLSGYISEGANHSMVSEIKPLYVQLYNPLGEWVMDEAIYSDKGKATGFLNLSDSLFSGIYRIKAFTREMLNAPTTIFEKQITIQNPKDKNYVVRNIQSIGNSIQPPSLKIDIISDKENYQLREKITLKIKVKNSEELPSGGTFSIAVTDQKRLLNTREDLDINLSVTAEIPDIQPITNLYTKESSLSLKGVVKNQKTGKTYSKIKVLSLTMDTLRSKTTLFESDKNGKFLLDNLDFEGYKTFAYNALDKKNKMVDDAVVIFEQFPPKLKLPILISEQKPLSETQQIGLDYLSQNPDGQAPKPKLDAFVSNEIPEKKVDEKLNSDHGKLYSKADYTVEFNENSPRFTNIYDMMNGNLPGLRVVRVSSTESKIFIRGIGTWNNNDPLLLVNGTTLDVSNLNSINPNDVSRIDLLSSGASAGIFGVRGGNGVVAIYLGRESENKLSESTKKQIIRGYLKEEPFLSPDYQSITNENKTDLRTTLYWNPEIITDQKGEASVSFYAADLPTTYRIIIEGMNSFGQIGRKVTTVEVIKK